MRIALVGTRGVPARYGGFETCVEEVGKRLVARGHDVVVYCRSTTSNPEQDPPTEYLGMNLVHLPAWHKKALETPTHTFLSLRHLRAEPTDVAIVFNAANAPLIPMLTGRNIPVATHVDGLEWRRTKWQGAGRFFYRCAESVAVRLSDRLIADAQGIADYYRDEFGAETDLIRYGAPIVEADDGSLIESLALTPGGYHLVVARFEPENHVHLIVEGFVASHASKPLVVVGSAPYADEYTQSIHALADERVRFLGGVWDQDLLDQLYAHAFTYLHGHSVGGTNPSLLRALGAGAPTTAFDVNFNREVIGDSGRYFSTAGEARDAIEASERGPGQTAVRSLAAAERARRYDWDDVAADYERLCHRLLDGPSDHAPSRPSGRRLSGVAE